MIIEQLRNLLIFGAIVAVVVTVNMVYKSDKDQITQEAPKYSQQTMKEAIIYFNNSKEYEKALLLAKEYVNLYPDDSEGWNHRGFAYFGLGNCVEALANFYHAMVNGNKAADALFVSVSNSDVCKKPRETN